MKRILVCLASAVTLALAACDPGTPAATEAQTPPVLATPDTLVAPSDPSAGPAGADSATWQFDHNGASGRPRLRYASYGVEDQALNLQCADGTAYAILLRGEQKPAWPFALKSGAETARLNGTGTGDSEVVVTATLPVNDPALAHFQQSGELTLIEGDYTGVLNAINDAERQTIAQFFAACG